MEYTYEIKRSGDNIVACFFCNGEMIFKKNFSRIFSEPNEDTWKEAHEWKDCQLNLLNKYSERAVV